MVDFTYINAAATRTGNPAITDLADGVIGPVANSNYEPLVLGALSAHRWKFATKTETLNLLDVTVDLPWLYAYQRPNGVLALRTVRANGLHIAYEVMTDKILINADGTSAVVAQFVWRVPESGWPGEFGEYITQKLEAMFLRAVGERHAEADLRDKSAERQLSTAKRMDSQSQPGTDPWSSPTLEARRA